MNKYYAHIKNNVLTDVSQCKYVGEAWRNIEVTKNIFDNQEKYIYLNGEIVENPDYEAEQAQKERALKLTDIIANLKKIDEKKIRAITEPSVKDAETGETWLDYYNKQSVELREEIARLTNDDNINTEPVQ